MDILESIEELINSYERSILSNDIAGLIQLRDRLAISSFRLAQAATEYRGDYNRAYLGRKISVNNAALRLMKDHHFTVSKADKEAFDLNKGKYEKELEAQTLNDQYDILLRQVNKILEAMSQRISYLKTEKHES